ncbi:hypothetical protein [Flavivirga spongiicola]|uniref:Uncharacterized protein n=1 Tax=Flavivirga spongiicola TaxID=421621 RepID=A0ABU7XPY3_9FLAO|nr:hypothetical protein [Flavivirga sp. MEBiC05379]MDO5977828.1 hypothetical protein [Flavivirga sp. MEBiC05379]
MKTVVENIQDQIKAKDTADIVPAHKILDIATKIESSEGAIIPKEAIAWIELQPSIKIETKDNTPVLSYVLYGIFTLAVVVAIKIIFNKLKSRSA